MNGKNQEWVTHLGVWEDKILCMDSDNLFEIDKVLGSTIKQLADKVRIKPLLPDEFQTCNNFNAILQPSWLVMDFILNSGKSSIYKELQLAEDVGERCNFYYPKVSFPFVTWNYYTGEFEMYGLFCEKNKKNPECYASHDLFWTFALKPVNYGVGCSLSEWADTGFICAEGISFQSPGKLLEGELMGSDIVYKDNQNEYKSPLGISGKDIVFNIQKVCSLTSSGTVAGKVGAGIGKDAAQGLVSGNEISGSGSQKLKSSPTGSGMNGLEERLSNLILPLLPCAAGSSGKGWREIGNAMKVGCSAITGGAKTPGSGAEDYVSSMSDSLGCGSRFPKNKQPIVFSSRLTQHGISGPNSKSGCGGLSKEGFEGKTTKQKPCAEITPDSKGCGKTVKDDSEEQKSLKRNGAYDITGKRSDNAKYKTFDQKDARKVCGHNDALGCANIDTNTIFISDQVLSTPDNQPVEGSGSPFTSFSAGFITKDSYTPRDIINHERDHIDQRTSTEGKIRINDVLRGVGGADFPGEDSACSGAAVSLFGKCIPNTGPNLLSVIADADWCKYAACEYFGRSPPPSGNDKAPDIGGPVPGVKDPAGGLGGDTRDEGWSYGETPLCAEKLLEMFGMIDCEINSGQSASSGGSDASFCAHGSTFSQEETQNPAGETQDSRCGSVASEFECSGAGLGISKMKSVTTVAPTGKSLTKSSFS